MSWTTFQFLVTCVLKRVVEQAQEHRKNKGARRERKQQNQEMGRENNLFLKREI